MLTFYELPRELRGLVYTNSRIESFNKQIKRVLKKQIQFVTEESFAQDSTHSLANLFENLLMKLKHKAFALRA